MAVVSQAFAETSRFSREHGKDRARKDSTISSLRERLTQASPSRELRFQVGVFTHVRAHAGLLDANFGSPMRRSGQRRSWCR